MTAYSFGDVVIVPVIFSDQSGTKKRPAVVVSSAAYHQGRSDVILMAVTSQIRPSGRIGEVLISCWQEAGLLKPSIFKPLLFTLDRALFLRRLGRLEETDRQALGQILASILEVST